MDSSRRTRDTLPRHVACARRKTLGYFGTAVEAAVAYARHCAELEASSGRGSGSGPGAGECGRRMRGP